MKSQIIRILKILAAWCIMILLSGCITTLPKVRSGNAEIGFDVFSQNTDQANMYANKFNSPTSFGIRINY
jgi:LEA14-like dessication related protein